MPYFKKTVGLSKEATFESDIIRSDKTSNTKSVSAPVFFSDLKGHEVAYSQTADQDGNVSEVTVASSEVTQVKSIFDPVNDYLLAPTVASRPLAVGENWPWPRTSSEFLDVTGTPIALDGNKVVWCGHIRCRNNNDTDQELFKPDTGGLGWMRWEGNDNTIRMIDAGGVQRTISPVITSGEFDGASTILVDILIIKNGDGPGSKFKSYTWNGHPVANENKYLGSIELFDLDFSNCVATRCGNLGTNGGESPPRRWWQWDNDVLQLDPFNIKHANLMRTYFNNSYSEARQIIT